ncbi:hypothetical protein DV515_00005826 [Chloebia gouldiae]|uniref:Androgen-dependent TFPI-regulating protein n=1 Tax=Chloebia gouldiae TaxID=44316 RepID=A0A3L8SNY9_CHLGU|nr:hypothetical protein DV515_00005826 [Chloebia gouldiae]
MEISTLTMYHCLAFVWYLFVAYSITHVKTEERPSEVFLYGGQWKYLTVLNLKETPYAGALWKPKVSPAPSGAFGDLQGGLDRKHVALQLNWVMHNLWSLVLDDPGPVTQPVSTLPYLHCCGPAQGEGQSNCRMRWEETKYHFELLGTEINFTVLQAVFYGVSFLADVLRLIKKLRCAKCVISSRDLLFSVLAFPVSTFVCISFWTLYTYNRELVYPKSLDGVIPLWLNHAMKSFTAFPFSPPPSRLSESDVGLYAAIRYMCLKLPQEAF